MRKILPIILFVFIIGCASFAKKECKLDSTDHWLEKSTDQHDQYIFEIYYSTLKQEQMSVIENNHFENFMRQKNYINFQIIDKFLTKKALGRRYRVKFYKGNDT